MKLTRRKLFAAPAIIGAFNPIGSFQPPLFYPGRQPFTTSSPWNTPISGSAHFTSLAWPASTGFNYAVNWNTFSPAIYYTESQFPLCVVAGSAGWGYPSANINLRIPSGVTGANGTDEELLIIDGTTIYNFFGFVRTSDTAATAVNYAFCDAYGANGFGTASPFLGAGTTAIGASEYGGLLVQAETDKGVINHGIALVVDGTLAKSGFISPPAIAGDGSSASGIVTEGQLLGIPPAQSMPGGLSTLGQIVFTAMKTYGAIVNDTAGGATIIRAQANAYNFSVIASLDNDMGSIIPLLQAVS